MHGTSPGEDRTPLAVERQCSDNIRGGASAVLLSADAPPGHRTTNSCTRMNSRHDAAGPSAELLVVGAERDGVPMSDRTVSPDGAASVNTGL